MTETERIEWGKAEHHARLADIAAVKAGEISLEEAQSRARKRSRQSGMTPHQAYTALVEGQMAIEALTMIERSEIERHHAEAWRRQIIEAGADENVAQQAVALAALNGLFDIHRDWAALRILARDPRVSSELIGIRVRNDLLLKRGR